MFRCSFNNIRHQGMPLRMKCNQSFLLRPHDFSHFDGNLVSVLKGYHTGKKQPVCINFSIIFAENCIRVKNIGLKGMAHDPPTAPLPRSRSNNFVRRPLLIHAIPISFRCLPKCANHIYSHESHTDFKNRTLC